MLVFEVWAISCFYFFVESRVWSKSYNTSSASVVLPLKMEEFKSLAWSSSIWMSGSILVISAESLLCIHFSTRRWSREALWTALHNRQPQVCFWERFLPWGILCPPPLPPQVHTFMKHPKFWLNYFVAHQWWFRQLSNTRVGQTVQWCEGCGKVAS